MVNNKKNTSNKGIKNDVNEQHNKKQNKRKTNTINFKRLIVVVLVLLVALSFASYKIIMLIMNPTDTFMVEEGSIYQEETTVGYIIRNEELVKGEKYKNGMEQIKSEGEKVAKNEAIFRYYSSGEEELEKKISDLDKKIDEAMQNEDSIPTSDITSLENQITQRLEELYQETDLKKIKEYKKDIDEYINKKSRIAGENSPSGSYLKKLIDERSKYENELNSGVEYVNAPTSGIVSYKIDGYEDILSPDKLETINKELLESVKIKTGQIVATNEEGGKIIKDFNFYIACILSSDSSKDAEVGDKIKMRFYNGREISAEINYISEEDDGDRVIIFKVNQNIQDLISYRKISLDIIWWSDSGKKIPNESIAKEQKGENEVPYVVRTRNGYTDKIYVKILRSNDKYSIVTNYTKDELKELGFTTDEIKSTKSITIYDEILKKPV